MLLLFGLLLLILLPVALVLTMGIGIVFYIPVSLIIVIEKLIKKTDNLKKLYWIWAWPYRFWLMLYYIYNAAYQEKMATDKLNEELHKITHQLDKSSKKD